MNNKYKIKNEIYKRLTLSFYIFMCFFSITKDLQAESMSGNTYTLNGSINVIEGSGISGVYSLKSSGDNISLNNSSGNIYSLYSGPYLTQEPVIMNSENQILGSVISSVIFGNQHYENSTNNTSYYPGTSDNFKKISFKEDILNPRKSNFFYKQEKFKDDVRFGNKTSTEEGQSRDSRIYINWLIVKIIFIGLLLIFIRVWYQNNKSL